MIERIADDRLLERNVEPVIQEIESIGPGKSLQQDLPGFCPTVAVTVAQERDRTDIGLGNGANRPHP